MLFPVQNFSYVANRALFPVYSRRQESNAQIATVPQTLALIASVTAPLMAGVLALRFPFVHVVLGPKWSLAADLLTWLAPVGFIQSLSSCGGAVFMAQGRTALMLRIGSISSSIVVASFLIGVRWGVVGVAQAYLVANVLTTLPAFYITMRVLGGSTHELVGRVWRPITAAVVMGIAIAWGNTWMRAAGWPERLQLVLSVPLGVLLYGAMAWHFAANVLIDVRSLLGSRAKAG